MICERNEVIILENIFVKFCEGNKQIILQNVKFLDQLPYTNIFQNAHSPFSKGLYTISNLKSYFLKWSNLAQ